jgi:hypothetical protein
MNRKLRVSKISSARTFKTVQVPHVRLTGKWLEAAGFDPGTELTLTIVSRGVIELRAKVANVLTPEMEHQRRAVRARLDASLLAFDNRFAPLCARRAA